MAPSEDPQVRQLLIDTLAVSALQQVQEVARGANVVVAPVKGVVLARWLYGAVAERPYRDLDLLVGREGLPRLIDAVRARGWRLRHVSVEMGELEFEVGRLVVEVHAEFGRRDLTRLTTADVIARASVDRDTFPFEVLRLDDFDHFLLLVANVTKKSYTYANRHQPADLERLLLRLEPRWEALVARAREASFLAALAGVARWMAEDHGSASFARFSLTLPADAPRLVPTVVRWHRRRDARSGKRLESVSGLFGLALATLTPDDWSLRGRGLARLVRRGIERRLGRDPG
jgi:hypothetical protein